MARIIQARFEEIMNALAAGANNDDATLAMLSELRADFLESLNPSPGFTREQVYGNGDTTWEQMYHDMENRYRDRFLGRDTGDNNAPPPPPTSTPPVVDVPEMEPTVDSLFTDIK